METRPDSLNQNYPPGSARRQVSRAHATTLKYFQEQKIYGQIARDCEDCFRQMGSDWI
jgi:hypothetical protein